MQQNSTTDNEKLLQELDDQFHQGFINEEEYQRKRKKLIGREHVFTTLGIFLFFLCFGCFMIFYSPETTDTTEITDIIDTVHVPPQEQTTTKEEPSPTTEPDTPPPILEQTPNTPQEPVLPKETASIPTEEKEIDCLVAFKTEAMKYSKQCATLVTTSTKVMMDIRIKQGQTSTIQLQQSGTQNTKWLHCLEKQLQNIRLPTRCEINMHYPIIFN